MARIANMLCRVFHLYLTLPQLRFRTDSDLPGVEKVAVTVPAAAFLDEPYKPMPPLDAHRAPT